MAATESARALASGRISSTICCASSRVGASTSPEGRGSPASIRSTSGTANAIVLPDPVGDLTSTSRPARASGKTRLWTGKASVIPPLSSASTTGRDAPRASKDFVDMCCSFAGGRPGPPRDSGGSTDPNRRSARKRNLAGNVAACPYDASRLALLMRLPVKEAIGLHVLVYRATGGIVGRRIPGVPPMLLLDHVGAKSGKRRTTPLVYKEDGETLVI